MTKNFRPEKYGMIFCPACSAKGYYGKTHSEKEVCRICGGFGLIKKENFGNEEKLRSRLMTANTLLMS